MCRLLRHLALAGVVSLLGLTDFGRDGSDRLAVAEKGPKKQKKTSQILKAAVPSYWFDWVEPRKEDDTRVCNLDLWDDGNGGGWKNSGNYSRLQTYFEICHSGLKQLKRDLAGRAGPVSEVAIWNYMCAVECNLSDMYHLQAIDWTGCRCMDLSTQKDSPFYRVEGDFCLENSAKQLCDILGWCGDWGCELDDFMCPSHEFRRRYFLGYGYGDCSAAFEGLGSGPGIMALIASGLVVFALS